MVLHTANGLALYRTVPVRRGFCASDLRSRWKIPQIFFGAFHNAASSISGYALQRYREIRHVDFRHHAKSARGAEI